MGAILIVSCVACDDSSSSSAGAAPSASAPVAVVIPSATATPSATAAAKPKIVCDPSATTITFNEPGLEAEIRKKVAKPD
ncbi:MAG: leucine-rich repeat domain-containing protein, partial [Polyangiaceae bacterium]